MSRSNWKGPYIHHALLAKIESAIDAQSKKPIKTNSRASTILPLMVGESVIISPTHR